VVRRAETLRRAFALNAAYLQPSGVREPCHCTPDASRRARGIELWAAMRSLGRDGLKDFLERNCRLAAFFAAGLRAAGFEILNDVVLNQVLVSFGGPEETRRVIADLQNEGTCWCGATEWHGRTAMRISVSNWATTEQDVERSLAAIDRICSRT
jgi:glutamate/tyrosine decarboxylase-like PLP-dependent enzyme